MILVPNTLGDSSKPCCRDMECLRKCRCFASLALAHLAKKMIVRWKSREHRAQRRSVAQVRAWSQAPPSPPPSACVAKRAPHLQRMCCGATGRAGSWKLYWRTTGRPPFASKRRTCGGSKKGYCRSPVPGRRGSVVCSFRLKRGVEAVTQLYSTSQLNSQRAYV